MRNRAIVLAATVAIAVIVALATLAEPSYGNGHFCPDEDPIDPGFTWTGLDVGRPPVASICQYQFLWWEHWHTCGLDGCF